MSYANLSVSYANLSVLYANLSVSYANLSVSYANLSVSYANAEKMKLLTHYSHNYLTPMISRLGSSFLLRVLRLPVTTICW